MGEKLMKIKIFLITVIASHVLENIGGGGYITVMLVNKISS